MLGVPFGGNQVSRNETNSLSNTIASLSVYPAQKSNIEAAKMLADANRDTFGFITRGAFYDALNEGALIVALCEGNVVGFLRYHHRKRDLQTTLYDICVDESKRGQGVGTMLLETLIENCRLSSRELISLKCPVGAKANSFYHKNGFYCAATVEGKNKSLNVWQMNLYSRGLQ